MADSIPSSSSASDTETPRVGGRLKHLRLAKRLRLKDLASAAGCSESLLSRIENNLVNPSLTTLHRLCKALGVNVVALLGDGEPAACFVLRPGDRVLLGHGGPGDQAEVLVPYAESRLLEGFITILQPDVKQSGPYQHDGEEIGYVLEGELELLVDGTAYRLRPGDSFFFKSDLPHAYRNPGSTVCRTVWINTPPTF